MGPKTIRKLTRFRKGGPLSQAHCEAWCAADDNCVALEMTGCNEHGACHGSCYHFYTLNFDQAVSDHQPEYEALRASEGQLKRFIKQGSGLFTPVSQGTTTMSKTSPVSTTSHVVTTASAIPPAMQPQPESDQNQNQNRNRNRNRR